jgi:hypothetical protein
MPIDENIRIMVLKPNNCENMTGSLTNGCLERAAIRNTFLRYLSLLLGLQSVNSFLSPKTKRVYGRINASQAGAANG